MTYSILVNCYLFLFARCLGTKNKKKGGGDGFQGKICLSIILCDIASNERHKLIYLNRPLILNALCNMCSPNL